MAAPFLALPANCQFPALSFSAASSTPLPFFGPLRSTSLAKSAVLNGYTRRLSLPFCANTDVPATTMNQHRRCNPAGHLALVHHYDFSLSINSSFCFVQQSRYESLAFQLRYKHGSCQSGQQILTSSSHSRSD